MTVVTPIDSCTSKAPTIPVVLLITFFSEKSSPLSTKELISDRGSELAAVEAGRLAIHASM